MPGIGTIFGGAPSSPTDLSGWFQPIFQQSPKIAFFPALSFDDFFELIYRRRKLRVYGDFNGDAFDHVVDIYSFQTFATPPPADELELICALQGDFLSRSTQFSIPLGASGGISFQMGFDQNYFDEPGQNIIPYFNIELVDSAGTNINGPNVIVGPIVPYVGTFLGYDIEFQKVSGVTFTGSITIEAPPTDGFWEFEVAGGSGPTWDKDTGAQLITPAPTGYG